MNKFIIGLVLGIAIAAGLAFYLNNMPTQFIKKVANNASSTVAVSSGPMILAPGNKLQEVKNSSAPNSSAPQNQIINQTNANQNANASSGASASAPSYDFYSVLQGEKASNNSSSPEASKPVKKSKLYVEAGAFSQQNLADDMKAQLTLLGFNPKIRTQKIDNKTISRVLIGPFDTEDQAGGAIKQLSEQNINALMYKVK